MISSYDCLTVLVDPSRAGLDDATLKMIRRHDNIVYVSCNPVTIMENLKVLTETHVIDKLEFFDQFPYTRHTETVALLLKE